jgi:hypothetical protein
VKTSSSIEIIRYVVLFIALGLLAPYAGCHIFTSPPSRQGESSEDSGIESSEQNNHNARREIAPTNSAATKRAPAQLGDLHELLSE